MEETLVSELKSKYGNRFKVITNPDKYFDNIGKYYSLCGSKIDWDKVSDSEVHSFDATTKQYYKEAKLFLDRICADNNINLNQKVTIIGDGPVEIGLEITLNQFKDSLVEIISLPQHTYILPQKIEWLFVYTMEGDMCFGLNPSMSEGSQCHSFKETV